MDQKRKGFTDGVRDGVPIAIGYFAVSFSLGIIARSAGFTAGQGFLASALVYASAGQYVGFTMFAAQAGYLQLVLVSIITNARYLLMGFALNQKIPPGTSLGKRMLTGVTITDEIFGITIARRGPLQVLYPLGAWCLCMPVWAAGATAGIVVGNILPLRLVSALSVALYGMFLAIIIPPSRKDKKVGVFVAIAFAASWAAGVLPGISRLSEGNRTILLTVGISALAALLCPIQPEKAPGEALSEQEHPETGLSPESRKENL